MTAPLAPTGTPREGEAQAQPSGISPAAPISAALAVSTIPATSSEPMDLNASSSEAAQKPESLLKRQEPERRRSSRLNTTASAKVEEEAQVKKAGRKRSAVELSQDAERDGEVEGGEEVAKKAKTSTPGLPLSAPLPSVMLQTEGGREVDSARDLLQVSAIGEEGKEGNNARGVVLFLVPKANTPGCTTQACAFRDHYTEIASHGFAVYCLSADSPAAQKKWKEKQTLPYGLLSDPKRELIGQLTGNMSKTERSHFIFVDGKLVHRQLPVKPKDSQVLALEFISALQPAGVSVSASNSEAADPASAVPEKDVVSAEATVCVAVDEVHKHTNGTETTAVESGPVAMSIEASGDGAAC